MRYTSRSPLPGGPALFIRVALVACVVAVGAASIFNIPALATGVALVWSAKAPMTYTAGSGAVAAGASGRIYYVGGVGSLSASQEYDPSNDTWRTVANMPTGRYSLAATEGLDGKVYAIGGWAPGWYTNAMEAYDSVANSWARLAPMPTARQGHAAATGTNGMIYAMGGTYYEPYIALEAVEAYNPASNTWTTVAPMPTARWWLASAAATNGKIYAIGGYDGRLAGSMGSGKFDTAGILDTVEEYDPATNTWSTKTPMPTRRTGLTAVATPDGRIYAIGGFYGSTTTDPSSYLATVEVYDTTTDTWTTETPMATPRVVPRAALVGGTIYVAGGYYNGTALATVEAAAAGPVDTTAPATTADLSGAIGTNGWYRSAVQVTLDATDSESGVDTTVYSLGGAEWVPYAGPFVIDREGTTTLSYYSIDEAGNREDPAAAVDITIDTLPPTVTYLGNAGAYTTDQIVNITCVAADGGSGIASSTCANVSGPASEFPLGENVFSGTATDNAGNVGTGAMSFTVQAAPNPYDTVSALIEQFVTKPGIAKSLTGKLDKAQEAALRGNASAKAGIIGAFVNEVEAQTGKALTADQAATLIRLALAL